MNVNLDSNGGLKYELKLILLPVKFHAHEEENQEIPANRNIENQICKKAA